MPENNSNQGFVLNAQTGRAYYGKALGGHHITQETWTDKEYESGYNISNPYFGRFGAVATGAAIYGGLRASPWAWNTATQATRAAEDWSPFMWGRTFQLSNIMSHREEAVRAAQNRRGGTFFNLGDDTATANYLQRLSDDKFNAERIRKEGVRLEDGKLYLGRGYNNVILEHAGVIRTAEGGTNTFGQAYTRANVRGPHDTVDSFNVLNKKVADPDARGGYTEVNRPQIAGMPIQFIGGKTKFDYHLKRAKAIAAEFGVYRFNRLLTDDLTESPLTRPIIEAMSRIPKVGKYFNPEGDSKLGHKGLGVIPGTPGKTAWRLGKKLALVGTAVPMAYDQLDWGVEQVLGTGITEGIATAGVAAHLGYAHTLDFISGGLLYDMQEGLENWVPGITSPYNLPSFALGGFMGGMLTSGIYKRYSSIKKAMNTPGSGGFGEKRNKAWYDVSEQFVNMDFNPRGPVKSWVAKQFKKWGTTGVGSVYQDGEGNIADLWRKIAKPNKAEGDFLDLPLFGRATTGKLSGFAGMFAGSLLTALPSALGFLIPDERPEELEAIYSGRKEVAVRKGRFWEFGRGDFEGDEIMYYRPHAFARMKSKYKEKAIWGDDYDMSPLKKFYLKNFTNYLEEKHYYDRPYPITSLPFQDVAFLGPVLSNTIGRLIKPAQYMHSEEWRRNDGEEVKVEPSSFGRAYATELGETPGGLPVAPSGFTQTINKLFYHLTEQAGLWGYALESGIDELTGTPGIFDQYKVMSSFGEVTSVSRDFYDLGLGGMAMTNEAFRRLYPSERAYMDTYNPLKNTMPSWLPGSGSRGPDFQHGDPYTKIAEGEYRLPGAGYAARFSDLKGLDPEDYPLIHKFKILADVAPHSNEFRKIAAQAKANRNNFDSVEESIYYATLEQLEAKRRRKEFSEYRNSLFGQEEAYGSDTSAGALAHINRTQAQGLDQTTGLLGAIGSGIEWALHAQMPWEYLTPLAPESKFNQRRTAVESYERENIYATKSAFWNRPIENFITPTLYSNAHHLLGWDGVPDKISKSRDIEEYFDIIEYVKNARLANIADLNNDQEARRIFEKRKDETLFGINPYSQNDSSIYRALPSRDKAYFRAFSEARSPEQRRRILELVPRNQRELYLARWKLEQTQDLRKAQNEVLNNSIQMDIASDRINSVYSEAQNEGFPKTRELYQMFMESKYPGENYGDWYRRTQLLPDVPLPGADWVGWHPSVELEDIKLRAVLDLGENMHDYGFYDTQLRALGGKPFLEQATNELFAARRQGDFHSRRNLNEVFASRSMNSEISMRKQWGPSLTPQVSVEMEQ